MTKICEKTRRTTRVRKFFLKLFKNLLFLTAIVAGVVSIATYLDFIDIPFVSRTFQLLGMKTYKISNGSMTAVEKGFTKLSITDAESAISAAQEVAVSMGYSNAFDELEPYISTSMGNECFYRLQQYYNGMPVYGRYVTVIATKNGASLGIISDVIDINEEIKLSPELSDVQVKAEIRKYIIANFGVLYDDMTIPALTDDLLVIYSGAEQTCLAYKLTIINGMQYTFVIDANTGEILECVSNYNDVFTKGTNIDGTQTFPAEFERYNHTYTICDSERDIYVYNLNKADSSKSDYWRKKQAVTSVGDNIFGNTADEIKQCPDIAINLLNNIEQIADYYETTFEKGIPYGTLLMLYKDGYDWGKNALGGRVIGQMDDGKNLICGFLSIGHALNGTEVDILAHEYAHIVAREYGAAIGKNSNDSGICEGLADVFACFYTGDWDMDITIAGKHRDASNPAKYGYPSNINDRNKSGEDASHGYATVISHAAYLMSESGVFSSNELPMLWYRTLLLLPYNCSFADLRFCMEYAAVSSNYTQIQRKAIATAFDKVGICARNNYKCGNSLTLNVYDKQGSYYDDYTIKINGKTAGGFWGKESKDYSLSINHQSMDSHLIKLENGQYTINIVDNANQAVSKRFEIIVKESYATENLYAFDFGADYTVSPLADVKVLDVAGNELFDYSMIAYNSTDANVYSVQSGKINLPECNYYHVNVSRRRENEGAEYYNTFSLRVKNDKDDILEILTNFETKDIEFVDTSLIPPEAVKFNDHYYCIYDVANVSDWNMAQEYCMEQGGYLATITSAEEDAFLYAYIVDEGYRSVMFGLSDQERTNDWRWVTGELLSYQNWQVGEPNHQGGYEHYGMYYEKNTDGKWNDGSGEGGIFICEWGEYIVDEREQINTALVE